METSVESVIDSFLRTHTSAFSVDTLVRLLAKKHIKFNRDDVKNFLENEPLVFKFGSERFMTHAGVFSMRKFGIRPSRYEIDHGILIVGHRCMPFVDHDMLPHELHFLCGTENITQKIVSLPISEVIPHYFLYGDEYIPQYISFDPANISLDFAKTDFELPSTINLTVLDMSSFYQKFNFSYNDRLLTSVLNWDLGILCFFPICNKKENPFEFDEAEENRQRWFENIETFTAKSLDTHGPCGSIEEQVSWIFADNMKELSVSDCGSFEEYIEKSKKISISIYGVETRLWHTGQEIPAARVWNIETVSDVTSDSLLVSNIFSELGLPISDKAIEAYLCDSLFKKEKTIFDVYKRIVPSDFNVDGDLPVALMLQLVQKRDIIRKRYNWFADFEIATVRSKLLQLYSKLIALVAQFGLSGLSVESSPQQSFVIMSQLFVHVTRLLESIQIDKSLTEKEMTAISLSIDGMNFSFQEIEGDLLEAIENQKKNGFTIINNSEMKNE